MLKLKWSGYSESERLSILQGGLNTYDKIKSLEKEGKRSFYRAPEVRKRERLGKKAINNKWYKKGRDKENIASVMFVEATPVGELIRLLKETEQQHMIAEDKRIKFVEKYGQKLINTIRINDPFRENCKDRNCIACKDATEYTNCKKSNIGYTLKCEDCERLARQEHMKENPAEICTFVEVNSKDCTKT